MRSKFVRFLKEGTKSGILKHGLFGYAKNDSEVLSAIKSYLPLLQENDYLVITKEGNFYNIQNSYISKIILPLPQAEKLIKESVESGELKEEEIKELRMMMEELKRFTDSTREEPVIETIRIVRYKRKEK